MSKFSDLFVGRTDVYGTYRVPPGTKPTAKGKMQGVASTRRENVTDALYDAHLKGEKRLGLVPIRPNTNDVMWLAMDVDEYKTKDLHARLAKRVAELGLPLVLTRTKSGGAHLWCFFDKPIKAIQARTIANNFLKKLGLKKETEIFPKQETIREEDDGSWINLPYFGDTCKAVTEDGKKEMTLDQFLDYANERRIRTDDLKQHEEQNEAPPVVTDDGGEEQGMPPCIATMLVNGIEEGGRDNAMMHIAVYLIKAFPDDWENRLIEMNDEYCHPPLSHYEIGKTIKSLKNKNYQYLCKQIPMKTICNKEVCLTRKFGVGGGEATSGPAILIDQLVKVEGEEPIYRVTMYGRQFNVDAETLFNYRSFQIAAMKAIDRVLPTLKKDKWDATINEKMTSMEVLKPSEDTQMHTRIVGKFKEWVQQSASSTKPEVIEEHGIPYYSGNAISFKPNDFLNIIDKQFKISRDLAWIYLHDWGVLDAEITIGKRNVKVWRYTIDPDDPWYNPAKTGAF